MAHKRFAVATALLATAFAAAQNITPNARPRASDLGLKVGILPTGSLDAITDVAGVEVGQTIIIRGDNIRTGVTAVLQSLPGESAWRDFRWEWFRKAGGLHTGR
jgi:hypothetical protein